MTHQERLLIHREHPALLEEAVAAVFVPVKKHDDAILQNLALNQFMGPFQNDRAAAQRLCHHVAQAILTVTEHVVSTHKEDNKT